MKRIALTALAVFAIAVAGASPAFAGGKPAHTGKVTICHAAGLAGTTKYVTQTIGRAAVYGPAGHFYENGTPRAGHEEDYIGPCKDASPSLSATPTQSPSLAPTTSPPVEPSVEPSDAPTPTPSTAPSDRLVPSPDSPTTTPAFTLPPTDTISGGSPVTGPEVMLIVAFLLMFSIAVLLVDKNHRR